MNYKKVFIFILTINILFLFPFIKIKASDIWIYEWFNTNININVGESVYEYKDKPYAILYRNSVPLSDSEISYDREGDWMYYLKNVNTNKVGSYYVWYKAFEKKYKPGTCNGYKCLIKFNVIDNINPSVSVINDDIILKRGDSINLLDNIIYKDDSACEIKILNEPSFDKIGVYDIYYLVIDEYNNSTKGTFKVTIYDDTKPKIYTKSGLNYIDIAQNSNPLLSEYFYAIDSYDGDISNIIQYPNLDTKNVGSYLYTISVTNSSNIKEELTVTINIIDEIEPKIEGVDDIILDYSLDFNNYDFKSLINIIDNNPINYDNLIINHNLENNVGNYKINYEYFDGFYKVYKEINVNLLDYVEIVDDSDPLIYDNLDIDDSNVNYNKEGIYEASIYVINSSGLSNNKKIKIDIINNKSNKKKGNGLIIALAINLILVWSFLIGGVIFVIILFKKRKKI